MRHFYFVDVTVTDELNDCNSILFDNSTMEKVKLASSLNANLQYT
jgi:hypothetical protein